ncbi:hypothetical protein B4U79_18958, partial [Dinothrombium tinctorium]
MIFTTYNQHSIAGIDSGKLLLFDTQFIDHQTCETQEGYYTGMVVDRNDESHLVTTGIDRILHFWDLQKNYAVRSITNPHITTITSADFVANSGQNLITCGYG